MTAVDAPTLDEAMEQLSALGCVSATLHHFPKQRPLAPWMGSTFRRLGANEHVVDDADGDIHILNKTVHFTAYADTPTAAVLALLDLARQAAPKPVAA